MSIKQLTQAEKRLLNYIRDLNFGEFVIKVQDSQPIRIEKCKKSIDLTIT